MMQMLDKRPPPTLTTKTKVVPEKDSLDQRMERIFDGNSPHAAVRVSGKCGSIRSSVAITLSLGWWRTNRCDAGAFHPPNSHHCRDFAALDQISDRQLNEAIANPAEVGALQNKWQGQALTLVAKHGTKFDVRQFPTKWHYHEFCNTCSGRGKVRCSSCNIFGKVTCRGCYGTGGSQHYNNDNRGGYYYWINCAVCYGSKEVPCYQCFGGRWVNCESCAATGYFTMTHEAKITAKVDVCHAFAGEDADGARSHVAKLPLETLLKQSDLSPFRAEQLAGGVRFRASTETSYCCRTYGIDRWTFDVCAVGHDNLIPDMPPIMDRVLGDLTAKLLSERSPARIHTLTSESALTRDVLRAIGGWDGYDLAYVGRHYEDSMSPPLLEKVSAAVKRGYDGVAGANGRKIWFLSAVATNLGLFLLYQIGASSALVKAIGQAPTDAAQIVVLIGLALASLAVTWVSARFSALRAAKALMSHEVKKCPDMGLAPLVAVLATCISVIYICSAMQTVRMPPQAVGGIPARNPVVKDARAKPLLKGVVIPKL